MPQYQPQPGDIAACYGRDLQSLIIRLGTYWPLSPPGTRLGPSHVAIMAPRYDDTDHQYWFESTTTCGRKCLAAGQLVDGVQVHEWQGRVGDYTARGGKVVIYRLSPSDTLSVDQVNHLRGMLLDQLMDGVRYDMTGAISSGARLTRWILNQVGVSQQRLFCSDQIAALLMRLNKLNRGNPNSYTPGRLLRVLVRHGVYRRHLEITEGWE
jgi:hypothetical protein